MNRAFLNQDLFVRSQRTGADNVAERLVRINSSRARAIRHGMIRSESSLPGLREKRREGIPFFCLDINRNY
jgi:hypothetical protein